MKLRVLLLFCVTLFLSSCCKDYEDIPIQEETKTWIPYTNGQQLEFKNNNGETFNLTAQTQSADYEVNQTKGTCSRTVESLVLKLDQTSSGNTTIQVTLESRYIYFGKEEETINSEASFDVNDNYNEVMGLNPDRYEFLPEANLNGMKYEKVVHYFPGPVSTPDNLNYFEEFYYAKGIGLVGIKLRNNANMFFLVP